jgi:hypothetical protein
MQSPARRYGSLRPDLQPPDTCKTVCQRSMWRVVSEAHTLALVVQHLGANDLSILNSTTMQEDLWTPLLGPPIQKDIDTISKGVSK